MFFKVKLFGSLSKTGKGHMTDAVILTAMAPIRTEIVFMDVPEAELYHPNTMELEAYDANDMVLGKMKVYSVGGGRIEVDGEKTAL